MSTRHSSGFTIIETVLFLSVTGLLVLGVLIGTGAAINNQRYRDATETLKSVIQEQYTALESVRNGRDNTWGCEPNTARPIVGAAEIRGQSDCMVVGRYMQIRSDEMTTYTVLARKMSSVKRDNDIQYMRQNYVYAVSTAEVDTRTMEWGTEIAWPESGSGARPNPMPRNLAVLFLRSPESGGVYTFTGDDIPPSNEVITANGIMDMIVGGTTAPGREGERTVCIKVNGIVGFRTGTMALYFAPQASGPSSIETRSNDIARSFSGAGAPQC